MFQNLPTTSAPNTKIMLTSGVLAGLYQGVFGLISVLVVAVFLPVIINIIGSVQREAVAI